MLTEVTGITGVRMLYLQLLYRCNFTCRHCFHGDMLADSASYTADEAKALLRHFRDVYRLESVTLLGGEPLLYRDIGEVCRYAVSELGLRTEICTNGHRGFRDVVTRLAPFLDRLRVSLDGLGEAHDALRRRGSFAGAFETLDHARAAGVSTGVTMTVTSHNIADVVPLARLLQQHGVEELKLHALRLVGHAGRNRDLEVLDTSSRYAGLHREIGRAELDIAVVYDADLSPAPPVLACSNLVADGWLDRIESDPRGGLTVSCKAVGRHINSFRWDKGTERICYEPRDDDELAQAVPDVVYVSDQQNRWTGS